MAETNREQPKMPGQIFVDALKRTGTIQSEDDLTPEQLLQISELNQSRDALKSIGDGLKIEKESNPKGESLVNSEK